MKKPMATPTTQKQLADLAYWQARGYTFGRDDVIPSSTMTPPLPESRRKIPELAAATLLLIGLFVWAYIDSARKGLV